jgi:hypothetical protein
MFMDDHQTRLPLTDDHQTSLSLADPASMSSKLLFQGSHSMEYNTSLLSSTYDAAAHQARLAEARRIEEETQAASARAIAAIENDRERAMVEAVDLLLSKNLGSAEGYLGRIGEPTTRRLQAVLTSYGVTPDYGASIGDGIRHKRG